MFGICLGMHCMVIEYARLHGMENAHSTEFDPETPYPVIDLMKEQKKIKDMGGTMRLGSYPCHLREGTEAISAYQTTDVEERHRHRFEVNNEYREELENRGLLVSGASPDDFLVEIVELPEHPWFLGCQFHPEFKSRPNRAHPLFVSFLEAAIKSRVKRA